MLLTGTLIYYYTVCKRKCYLSYQKINMEQNSELVKIGKELHEQQKAKYKEIMIDNIKIDKISKQYITEVKKSDADLEASIWQLKYYMYILNNKGIQRNGKLEIIEKNNQDKNVIFIEFSEDLLLEVENHVKEIENFLLGGLLPPTKIAKKCKKCAYYEYCII